MATHLRFYPASGPRRRATIRRDLIALVLVALFVWCGVKVYDAVERLSVLGTGVADAGTSMQSGFGSAADAVNGVPLVGDTLANALKSAGSATGGNLASVGNQGATDVHRLALLLGALVALLPLAVLLLVMLPRRIRQVRSLTAAATVLSGASDPSLRGLLASRAAFALPYDVLLRYTRDPFGDLAAGRLDALVSATLEEAGLRAPVVSGDAV
jgi:hypothetical protein